jgi:hypothetical protein
MIITVNLYLVLLNWEFKFSFSILSFCLSLSLIARSDKSLSTSEICHLCFGLYTYKPYTIFIQCTYIFFSIVKQRQHVSFFCYL